MTTQEAQDRAWAWYLKLYDGVEDTPEYRAVVEKKSLFYNLKVCEIILLEPIERFVDWLERKMERL